MKVPENWRRTSLRELGDGRRPAIKAGPFGSALRKEFYVGHGYRVYGQEQVLAGTLSIGDYYIDSEKYEALKSCAVEPGDILVSLVGTVGRALVVPPGAEPGIINPRLLRLSPSRSEADPVYISHWLSSAGVRKELSRVSQGGTMDVLNTGTLGGVALLLPPLPEQRKIAAILSSVDEAIEKTQAVIDQVQVVKKGLMQELLTKGMPGRHKTFKQTEIGRIPEAWNAVSIGEVAAVRNGTTPSKEIPEYWENGTIPWLPTGKVNDRIIRAADTFVSKQALDATSLRLLPSGSVLVAMIGQGATRGKAAYLTIDATINQNFAGITPDPSRLHGGFLFNLLDHQYLVLRSSARGSNQDALNCKIIRDYMIPLPPVQEQEQISDNLQILADRVDSEEALLDGLQQLKAALASLLLTGELRVRPEPTA